MQAERSLPTGTVSLLCTDIEGSTRLLHILGERYAEALAEHRRLLRAAFGEHRGSEVDTQGDAFFYACPRATAGKSCLPSQRGIFFPKNSPTRSACGTSASTVSRTSLARNGSTSSSFPGWRTTSRP